MVGGDYCREAIVMTVHHDLIQLLLSDKILIDDVLIMYSLANVELSFLN